MNWRYVETEVATILIKGTTAIVVAIVVTTAALFVIGETVEHFVPDHVLNKCGAPDA